MARRLDEFIEENPDEDCLRIVHGWTADPEATCGGPECFMGTCRHCKLLESHAIRLEHAEMKCKRVQALQNPDRFDNTGTYCNVDIENISCNCQLCSLELQEGED